MEDIPEFDFVSLLIKDEFNDDDLTLVPIQKKYPCLICKIHMRNETEFLHHHKSHCLPPKLTIKPMTMSAIEELSSQMNLEPFASVQNKTIQELAQTKRKQNEFKIKLANYGKEKEKESGKLKLILKKIKNKNQFEIIQSNGNSSILDKSKITILTGTSGNNRSNPPKTETTGGNLVSIKPISSLPNKSLNITCPYTNCTIRCPSIDNYRQHLKDVHSLHLVRSPSKPVMSPVPNSTSIVNINNKNTAPRMNLMDHIQSKSIGIAQKTSPKSEFKNKLVHLQKTMPNLNNFSTKEVISTVSNSPLSTTFCNKSTFPKTNLVKAQQQKSNSNDTCAKWTINHRDNLKKVLIRNKVSNSTPLVHIQKNSAPMMNVVVHEQPSPNRRTHTRISNGTKTKMIKSPPASFEIIAPSLDKSIKKEVSSPSLYANFNNMNMTVIPRMNLGLQTQPSPIGVTLKRKPCATRIKPLKNSPAYLQKIVSSSDTLINNRINKSASLVNIGSKNGPPRMNVIVKTQSSPIAISHKRNCNNSRTKVLKNPPLILQKKLPNTDTLTKTGQSILIHNGNRTVTQNKVSIKPLKITAMGEIKPMTVFKAPSTSPQSYGTQVKPDILKQTEEHFGYKYGYNMKAETQNITPVKDKPLRVYTRCPNTPCKKKYIYQKTLKLHMLTCEYRNPNRHHCQTSQTTNLSNIAHFVSHLSFCEDRSDHSKRYI